MFGFEYVYRGPSNSIFPFVSVVIFFTTSLDDKYDSSIPSIGRMYNTSVLEVGELPYWTSKVRTVNACQFNMYGEFAVKRAQTEVLKISKAAMFNASNEVYIKSVNKPKHWAERAAVIQSVLSRRSFLSSVKLDLESSLRAIDIDGDEEAQIRYLYKLKVLPSSVDWYKAVKLFIDVYPKPLWFEKEIKNYWRLCNE